MRKKYSVLFYLLSHIFLLTFVSCATGEYSPQGTVLLDRAIQIAAENIADNVPEGTRVAVLNFTCSSDQFSSYVIEELSGRLVNGKKLVVVDRRELDLIRQEENFQLSGEASDESVLSIGKKLGAQLIVSGSLTPMGGTYQFRIRALNVESAAIEASSSSNISTGETKVAIMMSAARPVTVNTR